MPGPEFARAGSPQGAAFCGVAVPSEYPLVLRWVLLMQQEGSSTPSAATAWAMTGGSTPTSASEDTRIPASGGSGVQKRPGSNAPPEQVLTLTIQPQLPHVALQKTIVPVPEALQHRAVAESGVRQCGGGLLTRDNFGVGSAGRLAGGK